MASIEPEEEKQPEIQPLQNTDTDSVSVKVENPNSGSEQTTEPKRGSFLTCYMPIPKSLKFLILCLLCICFAPVAYAFLTVATVAVLPLLLGAFVVVRLVQFLVRDVDLEKHLVFKFLLRYWIFVVVMLLLVELGLFYPIAKYVPGLKLATIIGLPITKWIKVICILIGIYLMSQVIWVSILFMLLQQLVSNDDEKGFILLESTSEIIGCLLFLWAEVVVMDSVPTFEQSKIFGIYTDKWIKVSLFLLIGYNIITFLTHTIVWSLPKLYGDHLGVGDGLSSALSIVCCDDLGKGAFNKKYVVYVATGIKRSIIFILSMVMLLITWLLYFGNRLDTTPEDNQILKFGTWTMVSILVCSFLWLIKSCILLYWEAHTVYDRLHSKITDIGKQLYFLIMLSFTHYQKLIESPEVESDDTDCGSSCSKTPPKKKIEWVLLDTSAEGEVCLMLDRKSVRAELINHTGLKASTYDIQKAAQRFLTAQYALSKESIVADLHHLQSNDSAEDNAKCIEILQKVVQVEGEAYFEKDWEMLLKLLPDVKTTEEITFQKVKILMERAHSRCMFLTNTLISENEVVKCLNRVISGIIIAVTCIMWLLLTGLAKTNVLVLIASPLLAATFIFGDTAKLLFQGLIFVYIVHPFDVGDLCVIDDKLLEVRRIGIWCTTFSKVRTIDRVLKFSGQENNRASETQN
ncbi:mechanosensitive ion channel protein 10-like isoform X2 [Silene latifolia]|uniref:mechanosensitive ion channel protein 10-like isoform X2 n=1 Tax=Silene latifolia TaxID=37657 RepID=UPI003D788FD0